MGEPHAPQHTVSAAYDDDVARVIVGNVIQSAGMLGCDRDTVLRAVIKRLEDAIGR